MWYVRGDPFGVVMSLKPIGIPALV